MDPPMKSNQITRLIVVVLILINFINNGTSIVYKGLYTNHIQDGKVVQPMKINLKGDISQNLTTFHHEHKGPLLINVTISEESHLLVLNPVDSFLAKHAVVERHKRRLHTRHNLKQESTKCHYHGSIKGHVVSKVAVSTCNGLTGMISTKSGKYWIEPYHHNDKKIPPSHKHIIYKRATAIYRRDDKKRRKYQPPPRDCGTREHPRITQLEWERRIGTTTAEEKKPKGKGRLQNKQRPKKPQSRKRSVRSVGTARFVETLLVADKSMVAFHQVNDVETYLLTVMNMVASLFQDPSIGHPMNIVVVKIVLLDESVTDLNITTQAEETLENFCVWQNNVNSPNDTDPYHHDVAILITRTDICSRGDVRTCDTLGVTHFGRACDSRKSCTVNEDSGINLAHTIAHQLGHKLGMYHDTESPNCTVNEGGTSHVMTPSVSGNTWSSCSRRDVINFLDSGLGACLEDNPEVNIPHQIPVLPSGAKNNIEMQCRNKFGSKSKFCTSGTHEMCHKLWCGDDTVCMTYLEPAASGTLCGENKWCKDQKCVPIRAMDGKWSEWDAWSECSRTCGAGVSTMQRECYHPEGFCFGERIRYRVCNTIPCPTKEPSLRDLQCAKIEFPRIDEQLDTLHPLVYEDNPCVLRCANTKENLIITLKNSTMDGTRCNPGKQDVCISGVCKKVGCDGIVNSEAELDECGVCQGNGETCEHIDGFFEVQLQSYGCDLTATIPAEALNVLVKSVETEAERKKYNMTEDQVKFHFEFKIPGPFNESWELNFFGSKNKFNPGFKFEYTMPKLQTKYTWILSDWSQCSASCSGGIQTQTPLCQQESIMGTVPSVVNITDESSCDSSLRPQHNVRICNSKPCRTSWWIGPWQPCAVTCVTKGVRSPLQYRSVTCADERQIALLDHYCANTTRPTIIKLCKAVPLCREGEY